MKTTASAITIARRITVTTTTTIMSRRLLGLQIKRRQTCHRFLKTTKRKKYSPHLFIKWSDRFIFKRIFIQNEVYQTLLGVNDGKMNNDRKSTKRAAKPQAEWEGEIFFSRTIRSPSFPLVRRAAIFSFAIFLFILEEHSEKKEALLVVNSSSSGVPIVLAVLLPHDTLPFLN